MLRHLFNQKKIYYCPWFDWRPLHKILLWSGVAFTLILLLIVIGANNWSWTSLLVVIGSGLLNIVFAISIFLQGKVLAIFKSRQPYWVSIEPAQMQLETLNSSPYAELHYGNDADDEVSARLLTEGRLKDVKRVYQQDNWIVYDLIFEMRRHFRNGTYKSGESYYTVYEAKLPRPLPHLLLDSARGKHQQFKNIYASAQRLQLGQRLDPYFQAFAPAYYNIDALSIFSDELTDTVLHLKEYDIELLNNSLLVYAPLLRQQEINAFIARCRGLEQGIQKRLESYKDSFRKRDAGVTQMGAKLLRNPIPFLWTGVLLLGLFASLTFAAGWDLRLIILFLLPSLAAFYLFFQQKRDNKKAVEGFKKEATSGGPPTINPQDPSRQ